MGKEIGHTYTYHHFKTLLFFVFIMGFGSVFSQFYSNLLEIISIILILIFSAITKPVIGKKSINCVLVVLALVLVSSLFTNTSITEYGSFIIRPILAILVIAGFSYDYDELKYYLYRTLKFVAWLAIANFIVTMALMDSMPLKIAPTTYTVHTIGYIFNYVAVTERLGITFVRNQGLFWEPGVLVILMNILVFIQLFEYKHSIKKIILPLLVIVTTASTSGFIVLAIILIRYVYLNVKNSRHKFLALFVGILFLGALAPVFWTEIQFKFTTGEGSAKARYFDTVCAAKIAINHPLVGIGPNPERYLQESKSFNIFYGDQFVDRDSTCSNLLLSLFAYYGFPMAIVFLLFLYRQKIINDKFIFLIIFIGLFSEPIGFCYLYFIFLMSSCTQNFRNTKSIIQ